MFEAHPEKLPIWVPKSRFSGIEAQTRNFKTRYIFWYRSGGSQIPDMLQQKNDVDVSELADGRGKNDPKSKIETNDHYQIVDIRLYFNLKPKTITNKSTQLQQNSKQKRMC